MPYNVIGICALLPPPSLNILVTSFLLALPLKMPWAPKWQLCGGSCCHEASVTRDR